MGKKCIINVRLCKCLTNSTIFKHKTYHKMCACESERAEEEEEIKKYLIEQCYDNIPNGIYIKKTQTISLASS